MARKRNHPLIAIVCWLGISLVVCLCALVWVLFRVAVPPSIGVDDLDAVHQQGMVQGAAMCGGLER